MKQAYYQPRTKGDNVQGSVCLSVSLCGHYWSESFVCLSVIRGVCADDLADAVDRLLIFIRNQNSYSRS